MGGKQFIRVVKPGMISDSGKTDGLVSGMARFALSWAQSCRNRPMTGPVTQTLAMISPFLPVILIAIFVPGMLDLSQIWSAASLTIAGFLLSAVVAQPLRQFLLEWAKLKPGPNGGV